MKKLFKICLIIIASLVVLFGVFIAEESIRLNKVKGSMPLIVLGRTKCSPSCAEIGDDITIEYYGFGYKLDIRYYHSTESSEDNDIYKITSEEFRLFNKFLIWAWIE